MSNIIISKDSIRRHLTYVSNVELESTQLLLNPLYEMRTSSSEVLAMQYL